MSDITESQFGYLPVFHEGCENQQYNLGIRLNATLEEAKKFAQQILQNQKDAQEYRKNSDVLRFLESSNFTISDIQEGIADAVHCRENHTKLQSQHKKLVDAIHERIQQLQSSKNLGMIYKVTHDDLIEELQNLLKESERE